MFHVMLVALILLNNYVSAQDTRWKPVVRVLFPEEKLLKRSSSQCDTTVKNIEGWIYTPNYPSDYDNYRTCIYVIERASSDVCKVEMTVIDFDLQDDDGCFKDYLEIQDGRQTQRLCGSLATGTKKTLFFPPGVNTITLRFQSDSDLTFKGFMLHLKQTKDSCYDVHKPIYPNPSDGHKPIYPNPSGGHRPRPTYPDGGHRPGPSGGEKPDGKPSCDKFIDTFSGRITSPNFPSGYPPGQICKYIIRRVNYRVCKIQLIFKTFHIEPSGSGCTKDYLELPDRSRLCGHYAPRKIFEFSSGNDILSLKFMSDYYGSGRGFDIEVTQIPDSCIYPPHPPVSPRPGRCDQEVIGYSGRFTSPNFPAYYGANEYCIYTIRRPNIEVCVVELEFKVFDVEYGGSVCSRDHLELPDKTRLCGRISGTRQIKYEGAEKSLILRFSSNAYSSGRGFDIRVLQKPNSCPTSPKDCSYEIRGPYGRMTSPGFPRRYGPSLRCRYTIHRPDYSTCKVQLLFRVFDVSYSINCVQDYLELPDRSRVCGSYIQTKTIEYPDEHTQTLVMYFITNRAGSGRGFDIDIRQLANSCKKPPHPSSCDQAIKSETEIITSPGYPADYPRNVKCSYKIHSFSLTTCRVRLEFLDFDVEHSSGCVADYLEITSTEERFCGAKKPAIKTVTFPTGSDTLELVFKSDGQTTRSGFQIKMVQLANSCYRPVEDPKICATITEKTGTFTSDNYPLPYNPETDCYYQIIKYNSAVCQANLHFSDFVVGSENDATCVEDYLEIQGTRYCGVRRGENVVVGFPSDKNDISLRFSTDAYRERSGFRIEVSQITEGCEKATDDECGGTYTSETFQIVSPGYQSGTYKANLDCKYLVKKSSYDVCALEIKYYIFDLEESEDCKKDYFQIGDIKLCGKLAYDSIRTYEFLEDELTLQFHSDSHRNSAGFFLSGTQIKC
ncbi:cubilin-like isoform X2 [Centruroides sculpturatus]|uniref:cubilin-like isoform X2 n=1 Tax=Centruroides sculpturatus TaxID=218467 RepID=UPI000C6D3EB9|nr:cubilin-like isoform X2 [Centruroides sculpturatus]